LRVSVAGRIIKKFRRAEVIKMHSFKKVPSMWIIWFLLLLLVAACGGGMQPTMTLDQVVAEPPPKEGLGPGDALEIKFLNTPEFNENQVVRPDGTIKLQLLGNVDVRGKSPEELRKKLVKAYAPQLKRPDVVVLVRTKEDRKVYVTGEVNTPGVVDIPGNMTILEAITKAGGFRTPSSDPSQVLVVRQKNDKQQGFVVNLRGALQGRETQAVLLQPHDVIYVPPSSIAKVNNWVEVYVNRMLPKLSVGMTPLAP
jgi:protein involved in polysaccharide export with SLBB domain